MKYLLVTVAYVFCYAITVFLVTPVQSVFLPEITIFASLMYLPHGVRILATWAFGWKAIPALFVGSAAATFLFTPSLEMAFLKPAIFEGIMLSAVVAFIAFELARFAGYDFYRSQSNKITWKSVLLIGAIASIVNSLGQTLIYSGLIGLNKVDAVLVIYAAGDMIGLMVCMITLMFAFRWNRLRNQSRA